MGRGPAAAYGYRIFAVGRAPAGGGVAAACGRGAGAPPRWSGRGGAPARPRRQGARRGRASARPRRTSAADGQSPPAGRAPAAVGGAPRRGPPRPGRARRTGAARCGSFARRRARPRDVRSRQPSHRRAAPPRYWYSFSRTMTQLSCRASCAVASSPATRRATGRNRAVQHRSHASGSRSINGQRTASSSGRAGGERRLLLPGARGFRHVAVPPRARSAR